MPMLKSGLFPCRPGVCPRNWTWPITKSSLDGGSCVSRGAEPSQTVKELRKSRRAAPFHSVQFLDAVPLDGSLKDIHQRLQLACAAEPGQVSTRDPTLALRIVTLEELDDGLGDLLRGADHRACGKHARRQPLSHNRSCDDWQAGGDRLQHFVLLTARAEEWRDGHRRPPEVGPHVID